MIDCAKSMIAPIRSMSEDARSTGEIAGSMSDYAISPKR